MKKIKSIVATLVLALSFLVSLFILYTPRPANDDLGFSAVRAASYISEISREPHATSDLEAHERVRLYLKGQLETFVGVSNVSEMNYAKETVDPDCDYDVKNLLATIPGTSATGILLVAHYDSRGHIGRAGELGRSYGAADDGYGLATLLEVARLYGQKNLQNSIYILMTDAEETGLYGAKMSAQETALMDNVGFVINVEARGIQGAAYMFETSINNDKVISFFHKAELPVSYSIATAVYTVMPNMTDFTEFLAIGKQGVNFAVLDGLYYYHTPLDNYTNINLSSIQHYGSQIVPLVEEYVSHSQYSNVDYFTASQNRVFFNLLPNVFISYTETVAIVINIVLKIAFITLLSFLLFTKRLRLSQIFKHLGYLTLMLVTLAISGLYLSQLIAFIARVPWSLTYVRMVGSDIPALLIIVGVITLLTWLTKRFLKAPEEKISLMIAAIFFNLLLATVTGFMLSGASFLFMVPAFTGLLSLYGETFIKHRIIKQVILSQNLIWPTLILVPLLFSLYLALTIGGLLALLVILLLSISIMIPSFLLQIGHANDANQ